MTTQTEALKLALEAYLCREMPAGTIIGDPKWWVPKIANAIKEALAQPEHSASHGEPDDGYCKACDGWKCTAKAGCVALDNPPPQLKETEQEPYGYLKLNTGKFVNEVEGLNPMTDKRYLPLYTTPPQPKEPEQEPVAKVCHDLDGHIGWNPKLTQLPDEGTPLYTHPPVPTAQPKELEQEPRTADEKLARMKSELAYSRRRTHE